MLSLAGLPENRLQEELRDLERDLSELKSRQLVGGDNIATRLSKTTNTWDVDQTVLASTAIIWWEIVFTPDHAEAPYAEFGFDWLVTPDSGFEFFSMFPSPASAQGSGVAFIVEYSNPGIGTVNVKLKFSVKSVDSGSLSWSVVRQV